MSLVLHLTDTSRGSEESFGGDTSSVDTSAADISSAKDRRGQILGAGVEGGTVTAYAAADDDDIVVVVTAFGGVECGEGSAGCFDGGREGARGAEEE